MLPVLDGDVVLVSHYRHAIGRGSLEAPRGFADGEVPELAARRELAEEIGADADELVGLGDMWPDDGLLASVVRLYLARIAAVGDVAAAEGVSGIVRLPIAEVERRVANAEICDGFTLAAFARARVRRLL